jgi:hypothetical protein
MLKFDCVASKEVEYLPFHDLIKITSNRAIL